jgi:hypothetical protein
MNGQQHFEDRFVAALNHHLDGWEAKVLRDFSSEAYATELAALRGDPVYEPFGLDCAEYVLIRLIGRMSISVGRRLGEIYDKLPRIVAAARFGLQSEQVAEKFGGLELDIGLRVANLATEEDRAHLQSHIKRFSNESHSGIGIEIRYNFNPNDSARLRKDVDMAAKLKEAGLLPVYLIFSAISPRDEAIARLQRGGWHFRQGNEALTFAHELLGVDLMSVMKNEHIATKIKERMRRMVRSIYASDAFKKLAL